MTIKLNSKTLAVVTGASRGNGKAIASGLEVAGADVVRIDLNDCDAEGKNYIGDVSDQNMIDEVVKYCKQQDYETLSLVNNAGVTYPNEYPYPSDSWDKTLDINLTVPYKWIEAFTPIFMNVNSGSVINITSLGAELAFPNNPAYIASKGGLKMLTKYYAKALGKYDITVNNLGPGYIKTDMTKNSFSDPVIKKEREKHTLLGRWGEPTDVSNVCVFLCSAESRYITGQDIYVDGGWTANGLIE